MLYLLLGLFILHNGVNATQFLLVKYTQITSLEYTFKTHKKSIILQIVLQSKYTIAWKTIF